MLIADQVMAIRNNKLATKHTITTNLKAIVSLVLQENIQSQRQLQNLLILDPKQATKDQTILNQKNPTLANPPIVDHKVREQELLLVEAQVLAGRHPLAEVQAQTGQHLLADQEIHRAQDNY